LVLGSTGASINDSGAVPAVASTVIISDVDMAFVNTIATIYGLHTMSKPLSKLTTVPKAVVNVYAGLSKDDKTHDMGSISENGNITWWNSVGATGTNSSVWDSYIGIDSHILSVETFGSDIYMLVKMNSSWFAKIVKQNTDIDITLDTFYEILVINKDTNVMKYYNGQSNVGAPDAFIAFQMAPTSSGGYNALASPGTGSTKNLYMANTNGMNLLANTDYIAPVVTTLLESKQAGVDELSALVDVSPPPTVPIGLFTPMTSATSSVNLSSAPSQQLTYGFPKMVNGVVQDTTDDGTYLLKIDLNTGFVTGNFGGNHIPTEQYHIFDIKENSEYYFFFMVRNFQHSSFSHLEGPAFTSMGTDGAQVSVCPISKDWKSLDCLVAWYGVKMATEDTTVIEAAKVKWSDYQTWRYRSTPYSNDETGFFQSYYGVFGNFQLPNALTGDTRAVAEEFDLAIELEAVNALIQNIKKNGVVLDMHCANLRLYDLTPTPYAGVNWTTTLESKIKALKLLGEKFGLTTQLTVTYADYESAVPFTEYISNTITFTNATGGQYTIDPSAGTVTDDVYETVMNVFDAHLDGSYIYLYAEPPVFFPSPYKDTVLGSEPNRVVILIRVATDLSKIEVIKVYFNQKRINQDVTDNMVLAALIEPLLWRYEGYLPLAFSAYDANPSSVAEKELAGSIGLWPLSNTQQSDMVQLLDDQGIFITTYFIGTASS
jgi:hypothetical protein